jgi:hypothetical protein
MERKNSYLLNQVDAHCLLSQDLNPRPFSMPSLFTAYCVLCVQALRLAAKMLQKLALKCVEKKTEKYIMFKIK